ncbi:unnamed protein product [Paramecium octaurelia]|uniref:Uncharacterized protein n=1 Tax=Paramecium octaurelia TaxID=43137 RepID=A0A8S1YE63_PAROT|nr:unnamed protein product [Paramecium octaurelia]
MIQEINLSQESNNEQKVSLIIDKKNLDLTLKFIEQLKEMRIQSSNLDTLKRRVVPFFMNQFYHWAVDNRLQSVVNYLKELKKSKESQQKKFELGDLKKLFSNQQLIIQGQQQIRKQARDAWQQFLEGYAVSSVMKNSKIKCPQNKQNYINYIPLLIEELNQIFPYNKLLSKYKSNQDYYIDINANQMISFENNSLSLIDRSLK